MTVNERIYDSAVKHAIYLLRLREGLVDRVEQRVREQDQKFIGQIATALAALSATDIRRIATTGQFTTRAAKRVLELIRAHGRASVVAAEDVLNPEIRETMEMEAKFWQTRVNRFLPNEAGLSLAIPTAAALFRLYRTRIAGDLGGTPRQRLSEWAARRVQALNRTLRGAQPNANPATIIADVRRVMRLGYRGLGGEVRSLHNHAISQTAQGLVNENDLIQDLVWVSILDSRTSDICFSRHGKLVNKELGGQVPPAHINCRSETILGVKSWRQLELKGLPADARNELDGRLVGAQDAQSAETWFNRQSAATQREILGPARFKAFKEDGLNFPNDFINRNEDRWTLAELERRENIEL